MPPRAKSASPLHGSAADCVGHAPTIPDTQRVKNVIGPGGVRYTVTPDIEQLLRSMDRRALQSLVLEMAAYSPEAMRSLQLRATPEGSPTASELIAAVDCCASRSRRLPVRLRRRGVDVGRARLARDAYRASAAPRGLAADPYRSEIERTVLGLADHALRLRTGRRPRQSGHSHRTPDRIANDSAR